MPGGVFSPVKNFFNGAIPAPINKRDGSSLGTKEKLGATMCPFSLKYSRNSRRISCKPKRFIATLLNIKPPKALWEVAILDYKIACQLCQCRSLSTCLWRIFIRAKSFKIKHTLTKGTDKIIPIKPNIPPPITMDKRTTRG